MTNKTRALVVPKQELPSEASIENQLITRVTVNIIAHFGNITSLEIYCGNIVPYKNRNNLNNIGFVIRQLVELLNLSKEDGLRLDEIRNVPCRLIYKENECGDKIYIGIGNFSKDKFILFEDLAYVSSTRMSAI